MTPPGRYRLVAPIARGGMAEVWRAEDRSVEPPKLVALKRMLPELALDPSLVQLFLDEATIARRLDHRCIVRLLDAGEEGGRPFHALELVEGVDAGALIERAPLAPELALYVAAEVAGALAHAHAATDEAGAPLGIVHRDVSPSNVLCGCDGRVRLGDFGIALGKDRRERTATGSTKGKAAYMSPEQLLGARVDGRADVFGLGCTLHALVRGQSPLASPDAVAGLLAGEPVELDPALDPDVRTIVARAIAPRAADRFPAMHDMEAALREALAGRGVDGAALLGAVVTGVERRGESEPTRAEPPPGPAPRAVRGIALLGAAALAALVLVIGLAIGASERIAATPPRRAEPSTSVDAGVTERAHEEPPVAALVPPDAPRSAPTRRRDAATSATIGRDEPATVEPNIEPPEPAPAPAAAAGVANFRLPRDARVIVDGGRTAFRDVVRGHACDPIGLCHLPVGRHELTIVSDAGREEATLCIEEGVTVRVLSPLPPRIGCE